MARHRHNHDYVPPVTFEYVDELAPPRPAMMLPPTDWYYFKIRDDLRMRLLAGAQTLAPTECWRLAVCITLPKWPKGRPSIAEIDRLNNLRAQLMAGAAGPGIELTANEGSVLARAMNFKRPRGRQPVGDFEGIKKTYAALIADGVKVNEAIREVMRKFGVSWGSVHKMLNEQWFRPTRRRRTEN